MRREIEKDPEVGEESSKGLERGMAEGVMNWEVVGGTGARRSERKPAMKREAVERMARREIWLAGDIEAGTVRGGG